MSNEKNIKNSSLQVNDNRKTLRESKDFNELDKNDFTEEEFNLLVEVFQQLSKWQQEQFKKLSEAEVLLEKPSEKV